MRPIYYLLLAVLLLAGCNTNKDTQPNPEQPELLGEMPEEMPADFDFLVRYGYGEVTKNEINTYHNTVVKDLIMNGTATADITLTEDEMRSIYERMRDIRIMGKLELVPLKQSCAVVPYEEDSWRITVNGFTRNWSWSGENCELTEDAEQLLELRTFIAEIVAVKEEYQALPEADGGYD
ncbi:hypothetical protein [Paenibacillus sp. FSL H3-0469]|uniref:hypothetical protein n=1 Tax=Paenibacillus sp. FSL H3-0469 TaxID=2954506 RepID=UPI0031019297